MDPRHRIGRPRHYCRRQRSGRVVRGVHRLGGHATSQHGLTLIELLIIMAVLGTLVTIGLLLYGDVTEQAKVARAIADIATIGGDIDTFEIMNDRVPNDLAEVGRGSLRDPWGNAYVYQSFAATPQGQWRKDHNLVPINSSFDLFSKGKDGQSQPPLTAAASRDDIVRANDGNYIGLAARY